MKNLTFLLSFITSNILFGQFATNKIPTKPIDNSREILRSMIDPAVIAIDFKIIKTGTGNVLRVSGIIKNKGGKNYYSGVNQQQVQLWENYSSTNRRMVKQMPFTQLNAGEEIKIIFERPAFKTSNEFPPDYEVLIVYDPDIAIDSNNNNDDAVLSNNRMIKNLNSR